MNISLKKFYKDDLIYRVIYTSDNSDNVSYIIDTSKIYRIVSVTNDFFGDGLTKYVSRDSAVIIPETETNIKEFGEYYRLQTSIDGNIITHYAVNINDISKNI